jgi:TRAP-type mannitol/chloroaromatic compound transport system permease small subunit
VATAFSFSPIWSCAFVLSRLFDRLGRKLMISGTYIVSALLLIGTALMILAGIGEIFLGVEAAQRSLEEIAAPLSAEDPQEVGAVR